VLQVQPQMEYGAAKTKMADYLFACMSANEDRVFMISGFPSSVTVCTGTSLTFKLPARS
jgi:hypothetical protein